MKKFLYILALFPLLWACSETVEFTPEQRQTKIVVNAGLYPDSSMHVRLSESVSILTSTRKVIPIEEAKVSITEKGAADYSLTEEKSGSYTSANRPGAGTSYQLKISHPDYPNASASCSIPEKPQILNIDTAQVTNADGYNEMRINLQLKDPGNSSNYYLARLKTLNTWEDNEADTTKHYVNYVYLEKGLAMPGESLMDVNGIIFNDDVFNGSTFTYTFITDPYLNEADAWSIELVALSRPLYLYLRSRSKAYETNDNPFAEPVQVYSNITDGLGIFAGGAVSKRVMKGDGNRL